MLFFIVANDFLLSSLTSDLSDFKSENNFFFHETDNLDLESL